jgi:hypothetical protein
LPGWLQPWDGVAWQLTGLYLLAVLAFTSAIMAARLRPAARR